MSWIKLSEGVTVSDLNANGLIDPVEILITTPSGDVGYNLQRLIDSGDTHTPSEVKHVCDILGVGSLIGVNLSAAHEFMTTLEKAESLATEGEVERFESQLSALKKIASSNGFRVNQLWLSDTHAAAQQALQKIRAAGLLFAKVDPAPLVILDETEIISDCIPIPPSGDNLTARLLAAIAQTEHTEIGQWAAFAITEAVRNRVEELLKEAEQAAAMGLVMDAECMLQWAKYRVGEDSVFFDVERARRIHISALKNGVSAYFEMASTMLSEGDIGGAKKALRLAEECIEIAQQEYKVEVAYDKRALKRIKSAIRRAA